MHLQDGRDKLIQVRLEVDVKHEALIQDEKDMSFFPVCSRESQRVVKQDLKSNLNAAQIGLGLHSECLINLKRCQFFIADYDFCNQIEDSR
jgi:hypothetical protein